MTHSRATDAAMTPLFLLMTTALSQLLSPFSSICCAQFFWPVMVYLVISVLVPSYIHHWYKAHENKHVIFQNVLIKASAQIHGIVVVSLWALSNLYHVAKRLQLPFPFILFMRLLFYNMNKTPWLAVVCQQPTATHTQMIVLAGLALTGWKVAMYETSQNLYNIIKLGANGQTAVINFAHYCWNCLHLHFNKNSFCS